MTRLLIIGSSHVGAYKNALPAFAAIHTDVQVDLFGVRGPLFLTGTLDAQGVFTPPCRDDKDRAFVVATNGADHIDSTPYDHVALLGHRFGFHDVLAMLEDHDMLEGPRTGKSHLMSQSFVHDAVHAVVQTAVRKALAPLDQSDRKLTFILAPFPAASITKRGKGYALSRQLGLFWARPDAAWYVDLWQRHVQDALNAQGHSLLVQPDTLNAGPYATKPVYAQRAAHLDADQALKTDHRHMNADYGLAMLRTLVETHLTSTPSQDTQREDA